MIHYEIHEPVKVKAIDDSKLMHAHPVRYGIFEFGYDGRGHIRQISVVTFETFDNAHVIAAEICENIPNSSLTILPVIK